MLIAALNSGRFLVARFRGHTTRRLLDVDIKFPVARESRAAFDRAIGAPRKEPGTQAWIARIADEHPGATFWDVGANIGVFSLLAGKLGMRVVAFEPLPSTVHLLHLAIASNGLGEDVVVVPTGLGAQSRTTSFSVRRATAGVSGSSLGPNLPAAQLRVRTVVLSGDDVSLLLPGLYARPIAVKIDVDGIELEVLSGISTLLQRGHVQHLMVEDLLDGGQVRAALSRYGFTLDFEEFTNVRNPGQHVNRFYSRPPA